ncbi:ABC transporter substrate-binding protein [Thioclava sp. GXIMD2076]|uniref:Probable sugar-binding periplasmic protein n=1 Tax=Thioclava kandeliae TaxID=3070818 RepID=A0ABV1SLF9_9RHOB
MLNSPLRAGLLAGAALTCLTAAAHAQDAEVIHFWTSSSEAASARVLADAYDKAGGHWIDSAVAGTDAARAAFTTRVQAGNPPTAMVATSVLEYQDMARAGYFANLDDLAKDLGWKDVVPEALMGAVTVDGHIYGAPVGMAVNNFLWTSPKALAAIGETEPPKTWDEFFADGDKLKEKGIIPYAHPGKWYWDLNLFGFVLASLDTEAYMQFHKVDPQVFDNPSFTEATEIFARLRDYSDQGAAGREWNLSTQLVMKGDAAFLFMGSWVKGELDAAGVVPGKDILCSIGVNDTPVSLNGDAMIFPAMNDSKTPTEAQALLAKTVTSVDTQVAFATTKGALPMRTDAQMPDLDMCSTKALAQAKTAGSVPAYPAMLSGDVAGSIGDVLDNFWVDTGASAEDLAAELQDVFADFQ